MKLAVVVQRYGAQINGGAELHARYIVELLAKQHQVEVLTTCARNYVTWRNEFPEGTETLRGVPIRRFLVSRERDPEEFGRQSVHVFEQPHSIADELAWLESEGPMSPALIEHLRAHDADYQYVIFFSYRYYLAYHGARAVSNKAILVPTAERDSALGLGIFGPIFRGVRALMYNSPEERAMIQAASNNTQVPGVVVGVGSDVPRTTAPERFRQKYHLYDPFVLYVGRIDENKGCRELFSYFTSYQPRLGQRLTLVLIGNSILPIPKHSNIRHLGYVSDQDKFDALAAAELLAMPSYYESLSMVALEAWALGKPVLANGKCDVLRGQCIRSRAGLFYDTFDEFAETLFTLTTYKPLTESLGENGRRFYEQHYAWPVIERKYLDMLNRLAEEDAAGRQRTTIEPLPGWLARRRKTLPPAADVVQALPHDAPHAAAGGAAAAAERSDREPSSATASARRAAGASAERTERSDRPERSGRSEGSEGSERSERSEGSEGSERSERSERSGRSDRPERSERSRQRGRRDSRHGRPPSGDRPASSGTPAPTDAKTGGAPPAPGTGEPGGDRRPHRRGQQRRHPHRGPGSGQSGQGQPPRDPNATSGDRDTDRSARPRRRPRSGRPGPRGPRGDR